MAAQVPALPAIRLTWWIDDPRIRRMLLRLFAAALAVFIGIPLLTLVLWSFAGEWFWPNLIPSQWSLRWWQEVLENPRVIAESLEPFASKFGMPERDGVALLDHLLSRAQYRNRTETVALARRQ